MAHPLNNQNEALLKCHKSDKQCSGWFGTSCVSGDKEGARLPFCRNKTTTKKLVLNSWNFPSVVREQIVSRRLRSVLIQALAVSGGTKKLW